MFPRPADVQRRYSIAQGGSGIMVHIVIEYFLKNGSEFTDLRTRGARWRGRRTFRTSRYNQKCNPATGALLPTPSRSFSSIYFRIHRPADDSRSGVLLDVKT